jgi:hypothetical protein
MKKKISVLLAMFFMILFTSGFGFAMSTSSVPGGFPFFHLGSLIIGLLIFVSLKNRYKEFYISECACAMALYTLMISLFTTPVVDTIKTLVS